VLYIKEHYPEIFSDLEFRFVGDGVLFDETLSPIKDLENVTIERTFLKQEDIAALHKAYGLFLSPTRMDSQGVSRDEAMSSGLVSLTNNITAIPEFVDRSCAILADADDHEALAEGIIALYIKTRTCFWKCLKMLHREYVNRVDMHRRSPKNWI
uniref:glycosyltransferase family 4 protein n=1 Tax=Sulfurovum sp. TaxID=1969726 RepID=UPI0025FA2C66